jgi:hypothetical protein
MGAPDENGAIEAMKTVQAFSAKALNARIDREVGDPMLGVFSALAGALFPDDSREARAKKVHLMVLGYLLRCEVEER